MQLEVACIIALLLVLIAIRTSVASLTLGLLGLGRHRQRSTDPDWVAMVLRFWTEQSTCVIFAWAATAMLSETGWMAAFLVVWQDMDNRPIETNAYGRDALYLWICALQIAIYIMWTAVAVAVQPHWPWWWRGLSTIMNLVLVVLYLAAAAVFSSIRATVSTTEYTKAIGALLYVQTLHALVWDCIWFGYSYSAYFDEYRAIQRCWVLPLN